MFSYIEICFTDQSSRRPPEIKDRISLILVIKYILTIYDCKHTYHKLRYSIKLTYWLKAMDFYSLLKIYVKT